MYARYESSPTENDNKEMTKFWVFCTTLTTGEMNVAVWNWILYLHAELRIFLTK